MQGGGGVGRMRLETAGNQAGSEGWGYVTVEGDLLAAVGQKAGFYDQGGRLGGCRTVIGQPEPDNPRHQRRTVIDDNDVLHMLVT